MAAFDHCYHDPGAPLMVSGADRTYLGYKSRLLPCWPELRDLDEDAPRPLLSPRQHLAVALHPILTAITYVMGDVADPFTWPESLWELTPTNSRTEACRRSRGIFC